MQLATSFTGRNASVRILSRPLVTLMPSSLPQTFPFYGIEPHIPPVNGAFGNSTGALWSALAPGLAPGDEHNRELSSIVELAKRPLERLTISDLVEMAKLTKADRALKLHETLKVGLANCAMKLSALPFGFCSAPSIRKVTKTYVQGFRQVLEFERKRGLRGLQNSDYDDLTQDIYHQHRATMLDVAKGVFEFYEDLNAVFGMGRELVEELRCELDVINNIEQCLDEFFTNRLTLRVLISHVNRLNTFQHLSSNKNVVGVVNVNAPLIRILTGAYTSARYMCLRDHQMAPELLVNGVCHEEYLASKMDAHGRFPYVHSHLFYIFFELIKNAARASVEATQLRRADGESAADKAVPPINVTVSEDESMFFVKIADAGIGMNRSVLSRAFSYFYSSVKARPTIANEVTDFDNRVPLAGFGFGLPISRVMVRYFSGDIDVNSIPGRGTDVHLYL